MLRSAAGSLDPVGGPLHYRWIDTDYGGTYPHTLDSPPSKEQDTAPDLLNLPAIGTWKCRTCVGVYMEISATLCFVAHINAAHTRPHWHRSEAAEDPYTNRLVTQAEGAYVREEVARRLDEESYRSDWPTLDKGMRVWLVCPMLRYYGQALSGTYIVEGIRNFLRQRENRFADSTVVDKLSEGFVVTFSTDRLEVFPMQDPDDGKPLLPDDGVHYVAHRYDGDQPPRWFINIGALWQQKKLASGSEHVLEEGGDGIRWEQRRRRWSV
jgi:hypothetical protein